MTIPRLTTYDLQLTTTFLWNPSFFPSLYQIPRLDRDNSYKNLGDEALLQRYRDTGDNQWLGLLLQRYTLLLLGVAMKYLKDKEQAQDAVQQVFLKALTHLPEGEILNFKGWLYVLVRNHCLQQLRDKTYNAGELALSSIIADEQDKESIRQQEYSIEQMNEALQTLDEAQRRSVILFYLEKKSYKEISDRTGFSFAQVKSYIQNGKRNLKLVLEKKMGKQP